jgi:hypothetical protein
MGAAFARSLSPNPSDGEAPPPPQKPTIPTLSIRRQRSSCIDLGVVASYSVNKRAVAHARRLIDAHQYVLNSDWGEAQPKAADENAFLESHSWEDYAEWYLGLTEGASEDTKARYGFVYGDFRRVHRTGLIACQYRAAEWRHKEVELAAHDLLQHLDSKRA